MTSTLGEAGRDPRVAPALPGQDEPQPLFRLRYGGSARSFGFAYYSWAAGRYEDSLLITGSPVGTPQEALDTIATFYVSGTDDEAPTNLQTQPLRLPVRCGWAIEGPPPPALPTAQCSRCRLLGHHSVAGTIATGPRAWLSNACWIAPMAGWEPACSDLPITTRSARAE